MSAQAQAGLELAHDPGVPRRDALLDGGAVGAALAEHAGASGKLRIECCTPLRAKYRVGDSLRVVYRVETEGEERWVAARSLRPERAQAGLRAGLERAVGSGPLRAVTHVPELGAVFYAFPNDRKIVHLRLLAGGLALERLVGHGGLRPRLVAWAPEASATARCEDSDGRAVAYVKAYAGDEARRTEAIHSSLRRALHAAGGPAPRVGAVLASSPAQRALALAPLPGVTLLALADDERGAALERLGAALAVLHGVAVPAAAPRLHRLDVTRLRTAAAVVARVRPDVEAAAAELVRALEAATPPEAPRACLHGDPHQGNALWHAGAVGLVDLDHVCAGPAAADLARVAAGLTAERVLGRLDATTEERLADRFAAGYADVRPLPDPDLLRWHGAATLLARHVLPAVSRLRAEALGALPDLLAAARERLR